MMYQLQSIDDKRPNSRIVHNQDLNVWIPISPDNTDYQQFKKELASGVELKDAEGNQMTPEQITTFLETLP